VINLKVSSGSTRACNERENNNIIMEIYDTFWFLSVTKCVHLQERGSEDGRVVFFHS
jgi:hypothetical protein